MNNWSTRKLGDIVKAGGGKIHTGPFGSQLHASDYVPFGIPCIMPANMKDNRVDLSKISFIAEHDAKRLSKYLVKCGDIVYSRRGDVTQKALIKREETGYFCGTGCLLVRPGSEIDPEFLTYYLSTTAMKSWIKKQAVGATMPNLNTGILANIPFTGPEKQKQKQISSVISSIDKKIETNNKINTELEAMAKLIYDYWFVQFDFPNANGKPYKSSGGKMVYNEELKREIPDGWDVEQLQSIAKNIMGQSPKGESYNNANIGLPLLNGPADYKNGALYGRTYTTEPTRLCEKDDMVLCIRATIGKLVYSEAEFCLGRGVAAVRPNNKIHSELIYFILLQEIKRFKMQATGSIIKGITKDDLTESKCLMPNKNLILSFHKIIKPMFDKQRKAKIENIKLIELRDWLLPMLMNGQVTVKDANG
ncbi:MAG: type I restriction enzyme S subunit [Candidatus Endobugula sp.]|jgi:type I restriction enzyme S subunit